VNFNNLKIQRQLVLGFGVSLAIFALSVGVAYWFLVQASRDVDAVISNRYPKIMGAQSIIKRTIDNGRNLRAAAAAETPQDEEVIVGKIAENRRLNSLDIEKLEKTVATEKGRALMDSMKGARDRLGPMYDKAFALIRAGDKTKTTEYLKEVGEANNALWKASEEFSKYQEEAMAKVAEEAQAGMTSVQRTLLGATLVAVMLSIGIALGLARRISRRLEQAVGVAEAIAQGRLDQSVEDDGADEIADLLAAMMRMQGEVSTIVVDIKKIVSSAEKGDLSKRMSLEGKAGFGREIGESLNQLLATTDTSLQDIARVATALAHGDLSHTIHAQYQGAFGITADAVNTTVKALAHVVGEVRDMANAVSQGDFNQRIAAAGKEGYALELAELLNRLCSTANEALSDIARVSQSLASGDLTQQIEVAYPGLFGSTAEGINEISRNLQKLIGNIVEAVNLISTAAQEIATGNQDLSSRTESQASSLEETASSMEELTSAVKNNTDHAGQCNGLTSQSKEVAIRGGEVVGHVVTVMNDIHDSSKKISNIIGVIDGIAFQTNILALNAAVEAARAGEQGRGFAVVATEVRNLAQRSASAAKEIKALIDESVSKVEQGNKMAEEAGSTMQAVVHSIQEVATIMSEITAASQEQSAGIEEVGKAVSQMDEMTQQNAALVEEAAAAAESLEEQARNLSLQVSRFKVTSGGGQIARRAALPRRTQTVDYIPATPDR